MLKDRANMIGDLVEQLIYHKKRYYAGAPEISDASYDALEEELRALAPKHPFFSKVGSPPLSTDKVAHKQPVLSLDKTYSLEDLQRWAGQRMLFATYKLDGNCLSLIYEHGVLTMAKTRGDGRFGENVTAKARWARGCVAALKDSHLSKLSYVEIRGELCCSRENFAALAEEMARLKLEAPSSPRNIVAGVLGRKHFDELARFFTFYPFDVQSDAGNDHELFSTDDAVFSWLRAEGFPCTEHALVKNDSDLVSFLESTKRYLTEGAIGIDGAVFSYNDRNLRQELGSTAHHPRYKLSFKWQGESAATTIRSIDWRTSRLGIMTPVAIVDAVNLSSASITNVTLHNAANVKNFNLKAGDSIEIIRSGEVIPKFLQVLHAASGHYVWPQKCLSCDTPANFDGVRLLCPNTAACPAQRAGIILNWIRCAEIDDLSEKRLLLLMDAGLVSHMADLYTLSEADFLTLPKTGEVMAAKLVGNIQSRKKLPLVSFLCGLGIKGLGKTAWGSLLAVYPSLEALQEAKLDSIVAIRGFSEKLGEQVVRGLAEAAEDIRRLQAVGVEALVETAAPTGGPLSGRSFVITGSLSRPRKEIADAITQAGGTMHSAVSRNTSVLICEDTNSTSSKAQKARELGVEVWAEDKLWQEISQLLP